MNRVVAIDFETANYARVSACSLGLVVLDHEEIIERKHFYFKPIGGHTPFHTAIHGITEEQTNDAPYFFEVFQSLKPYFAMGLLGYTTFDQQVLNALLKEHSLRFDFSYQDVCQLAKILVPDAQDHRLPTMAEYFHVPLEKHHDALEDAEACAKIFVALNRHQRSPRS